MSRESVNSSKASGGGFANSAKGTVATGDQRAARKLFMGVRLRRLREERDLSQLGLARLIGISPSYLNQLENDRRPTTVPVLLRIAHVLGVDLQVFSEDEEVRRLAAVTDVLAEGGEDIPLAEAREVATNLPAVAAAITALHRRYREAVARSEALAARLGDDPARSGVPEPYEEVREFFYARHNHIAELDEAAEGLAASAGLTVGSMAEGIDALLRERHGARTVVEGVDLVDAPLRAFDSRRRVLRLSPLLEPGQRAFQAATQLALLEYEPLLGALVDDGLLTGLESRRLARIGLANYFAGALILPYGAFLSAAEGLRYDIERLCTLFGVGFETVCHRLSTLQRPGAGGVPFFFVRVDRAGNVSKRQSATSFHFSRIGGTCPLWNVYEAFSSPGRILTQLARMPDGRVYLWVARTVSHGSGGYGMPARTFAVALGCDVRHAHRLIYSSGLDLADADAATPIGLGCRVCERPACAQRAFPHVGRPVSIEEGIRHFEPYRMA